jgi:hypothetical protein
LEALFGDTAGGSRGEVVMDAEKDHAADQLVQHLSRLFLHLSHFFVIFISIIFYNASPLVFWKQC